MVRGDEANDTQSHSGFKASVALAACKGDMTLAGLAAQFASIPSRSWTGSRCGSATRLAARSRRRTPRISSLPRPVWQLAHRRALASQAQV